MENKVLAKVNGVVSVEEANSRKTGNPYKAVYVTFANGQKVQIGFFNAMTELAFLKAGVKVN